MKIGIIGYGVVGKAIEATVSKRYSVVKYDKFVSSDPFKSILSLRLRLHISSDSF